MSQLLVLPHPPWWWDGLRSRKMFNIVSLLLNSNSLSILAGVQYTAFTIAHFCPLFLSELTFYSHSLHCDPAMLSPRTQFWLNVFWSLTQKTCKCIQNILTVSWNFQKVNHLFETFLFVWWLHQPISVWEAYLSRHIPCLSKSLNNKHPKRCL